MTRFEEKTVIVTGASKGIGAVIAERLHAEGAHLVLVSRSEGAVTMAERLGGSARAFTGDVGDPATAAGAVALAAESGGVDVLVNNAGLDLVDDLLGTSVEDTRKVFDANALGPLWMLQHAAKAMKVHRRGGSIVNVTSRLASIGVPGMTVYGASKGALLTLTRGAAVELAGDGIRVNAVAPGMTATPMFEEFLAGHEDGAATLRFVEDAIPQRRLGLPDDVAAAVAFLASEESAHITGASLPVDGGYTAA